MPAHWIVVVRPVKNRWWCPATEWHSSSCWDKQTDDRNTGSSFTKNEYWPAYTQYKFQSNPSCWLMSVIVCSNPRPAVARLSNQSSFRWLHSVHHVHKYTFQLTTLPPTETWHGRMFLVIFSTYDACLSVDTGVQFSVKIDIKIKSTSSLAIKMEWNIWLEP